jgi:hypothetical protein
MSLAQPAAFAGVSRNVFLKPKGYCTSETLPFRNVTFTSLYV